MRYELGIENQDSPGLQKNRDLDDAGGDRPGTNVHFMDHDLESVNVYNDTDRGNKNQADGNELEVPS